MVERYWKEVEREEKMDSIDVNLTNRRLYHLLSMKKILDEKIYWITEEEMQHSYDEFGTALQKIINEEAKRLNVDGLQSQVVSRI